MDEDRIRFPIGKYIRPALFSQETRGQYIRAIETFPSSLSAEVSHLTDVQLDTPYRTGGWTIRQVVHHCADSHMNSLMRFKLALTEDKPTIKPYLEARWAELADSKSMAIEPALALLDGLHKKWAVLLKSLTEADLTRCFIHPDQGKEISLEECMGFYAWHGHHHLAHITTLKHTKNWE